jgi:hypothetical protein
MSTLLFLQQYSGALTLLATVALVALTAFYAYWTRGILQATANQSRLSLSPVLGIEINKVSIGKVFGRRRRSLSVNITLTNVGNAPAIEVLVDADIELRYSRIQEEQVIPARFEPEMVPFIRPGDSIGGISLDFGNTLVTHFFDDLRESTRLNLHRIETDPTREPHLASRLRVVAYYRNSLGQYFKSHYVTEVTIWSPLGEEKIPSDDETAEITLLRIPRPVFHAGISSSDETATEISLRDRKRELCGW